MCVHMLVWTFVRARSRDIYILRLCLRAGRVSSLTPPSASPPGGNTTGPLWGG